MSEIEIDQLIDSTRVDGSGAEVAPPSLAPLSAWSEVDPDYAEFATDDSDPDEDEDADDLTQEEIDAPEPDGDSDQVIEPVGIELWGQNLDEGTEWVKVAEQDLDGDGEAGIAMIPSVPTSTSMRYRLRLVYSDGSFSKWSEQQEVTTPRDMTPPPVPSAPQVTVRYGHAQGGWDGELTGEIPIDFDHTRFHVQQMEPESGEEPPEGGYVTGDPQLLTRFSSEGSHMLGFLPEAEHRAFLTSVDTSNNESARSEYTYFTPTPPVDREAIEEEVDKVDDRMDDLRETLEQGLSDEVTRLEGEIETAGGTTILRRTSEPTTEDGADAAEGTIWYQYTTLDSGGELDGMWTWDGTDWVESTISEKIMAKVHIEEGTAGSLGVDRVNGLAAQFRRLHVGGSDNLFPIEALEDFRDNRDDSPDWFFQFDGREEWGTITGQGGMDLAIRRNDATFDDLSSRLYYRPNGEGIHTQEGEQFRLALYGWQAGSGETDGARNLVCAYFRDRHGSLVNFGDETFFESGWNNYTHDITVPEDAERMEILFESESGAPRGHWGDFDLRRMNDGELTIDGSVKARSLDVEDLAADEARMNEIWGGLASFVEGRFDQLFANDFQARTIEGASITGGFFETLEASDGVTAQITTSPKEWTETRVTPQGVDEVRREALASHLSFYVDNPDTAASILRGDNRLVIHGGEYANPIGYEGSRLGEVVISGSRLISPRTDAGHTFADSLRVTDGGLVGTSEELILSGWNVRRTVGEVPHVVRLGRQVIVGGAIAMDNPGSPPMQDRDPWGATWRYIRGFPAPDAPKRFQVPIISGGGDVRASLTFEIDITGTGRFIGEEAEDYRNAFTAHFDGIAYMTSVADAGEGESRNRLPDTNFMHLDDPEMYYAPNAWANSTGSGIDSPGDHFWTRTHGVNGRPQLTVENLGSGTYRIALRYRKGEGIEVNQGQRVSVFFRYWNPDDSMFRFRPFFFDAETGDPLTGSGDFDHRLSRYSSERGYEWSWDEVIDLGGSGRYYMVPTFHVQPSSASENYNVRSMEVIVGD